MQRGTNISASAIPSSSGAELPSGVVSFLLTDVEGSTHRWELYPDAMREALERHDAILRDAVLANKGHIFKTAGDSFHAAFSSPGAAVAAALQAQQGCHMEAFPGTDGFKVRMAVHAGPVETRGGDYYGQGINRAARLLFVAYGGQVLISGTIADMLQGKLPPQSSLFDLGRHRFRDLSEPEQVFQLVAPDIATAFPPLRSLGVRSYHLPHPLTQLIGRARDLEEVRNRLGRYRLLTLTGSGGSGKTRLAIESGYLFVDEFPDGVWFVELGPLDDPQLVAEQICGTIGVAVHGSRSAVDCAVGFLKEKRALLILDNCEHLIGAVAAIVEAISTECASMALLTTSREPLGVPGESIYRVPRLAVPGTDDITTVTALDYPAIQLFVERATAVTENFELTDSNLEAVVSICRQVDGIPLAIELAVPRLRMMRPEWIAARLRDRFRLLGSGSRTVEPRHRTLQTLFDWSYNLLDEREQTLLRRLAVFAGGWNVDSAVAVVSGEPVEPDDILDLITALADKSLVVADLTAEVPRYRLLETTRQYSLEKLRETGERGRRRLLAEYLVRFFAGATASWPTMSTAEWMSAYEPEIENLRAALEWAFGPDGDKSLGMHLTSFSLRIWDELSLLPERERWFRTAILSVDDDTPAAVKARLWLGCTSISEHGDRSAFDAALKAVDLFRTFDDQLDLGEALTKAGASILTPERREEAARYLDEALDILRNSNTKQLASCLRSAAVSAYFDGDYDTARSRIKECVSVTKIVGDEHGLANAMIALAELEFAAGENETAISIVRRTIDEGHCNRRQLTLCVGNLTSYLLAADRLSEAKLTSFNGLHKAKALGWPAAIVRIVELIALIAGLGGDLERAARLIGYTEGFYALETASREITEKVSYERLLRILEDSLGPDALAKYRWEGARLRESQIVQMAMEA